jgi:hypothetical protein
MDEVDWQWGWAFSQERPPDIQDPIAGREDLRLDASYYYWVQVSTCGDGNYSVNLTRTH